MIQRNIFPLLLEHILKKQITVITGMRRVGKTTAIHYLLSQIESENKIYIDLEKVENRYTFQQSTYKDVEISLQIEGIDLSKKAFIAIDEIQLVPELTSIIKYLYDTYDIKFILSGSSSFYLKHNFAESLAGRKRIFEMHTLTFSEFLLFKGKTTVPKELASSTSFNLSLHTLYSADYYEYITYGGFPEVVSADSVKDKTEYLKDIINSYIELDIKLLSDFSKSTDIYKLIRLLSTRIGSKVDYTKLASVIGIPRNKIRDYMEFLEFTYFIRLVPAYVTNTDREISKQHKVFFTDNGLATVLGNNNLGQLLENSIANQLSHHGKIFYYAKKTGQEIDFILDGTKAFEVKETPTLGELNTLQKRCHSIGIKNVVLVGLNPNPIGFTQFTWAGCL